MTPEWLEASRQLPPSVYRRYLVGAGWEELEADERRWRYRRSVRDQEVCVEVPRKQDYADYSRRVAELIELIEILALVEERPASAIVFDLGQAETDVLAFRFGGPETRSGTISISDSARIRAAQKQLLLAAAHSVIEPRIHHPRLSRAEAVDFVDSCREAPGSYVSPILVPTIAPTPSRSTSR